MANASIEIALCEEPCDGVPRDVLLPLPSLAERLVPLAHISVGVLKVWNHFVGLHLELQLSEGPDALLSLPDLILRQIGARAKLEFFFSAMMQSIHQSSQPEKPSFIIRRIATLISSEKERKIKPQ